MRSVAFALIWQDYAQTLSDEGVNEAMQRVIEALRIQHGAQLRDN